MNDFMYKNPGNDEELRDILSGEGGEKLKLLAGGTDLLGTLKDDIHGEDPVSVVSLSKLSELASIKFEEDGLHIGAMTKLDEVVRNKRINDEFSILSEAANTVATPQIRNIATVGGNLCQEPRCWYYRYRDNYFDCLRKGGKTCYALVGNNMYHSIFGAVSVGKTACYTGCPNGTEVPFYMDKIRNGDIVGAAKILFGVNPLAMVTGRVCPHSCQNDCARGEYDDAVGIRNVERYLGDHILDNWKDYYKPPHGENGKRVAIIGAGPAGLTEAYLLRTNGFAVTVYDENSHIGGMLYYGIPAYRLPKDILDRLMRIFIEMGILFEMNSKIGRDHDLTAIRNDVDAVVVCNGAWVSQPLGIPGGDAKGVVGGIVFLNMVSKGKDLAVAGKRVIVIGGGNTAMDACRTAKRLGADSVIDLYRRTRNEMPADDLEIDTAGEEGVEFKFLSAPIEILEGGEGGVSRIKVQKMELGEKGSDGRRKPIPVHGAVEDLPADLIIVATGQAVDIRGFDMLEHKTDNTFIVDEETSMSSADGIFCAGDSLHGPGTVIEAIKMARDTASSVAEYLGENSILHENEAREAISDHDPASRPQWYDVSCDESCLKNSEASKIEMKVVSDRDLYHEDESPFPPEAAVFESKRCLNCGCVAVNASDLSPVLIALNAKLVTSDRTIDAADFFDAGINAVTVLDRNEYLKEIVIPAQEHRIQLYEKYRSRNAIDFPIVSVAAVLDVHHGTVRSAKLVLGAVKPVPYEPREVESFMESGILDERLIDEAADRAVAEAIPLAENAYKIQITKAMVKRVLRRALQRQ